MSSTLRLTSSDGLQIAHYEWGESGHGGSDKPHVPASCGEQRMGEDLGSLLEATGVAEMDLVGYWMGAVVALLLDAGLAPSIVEYLG
jgi:pimeloyl-ACP methyl ester carboxylesterase